MILAPLLLLLAAAWQPAADRAGNRLEPVDFRVPATPGGEGEAYPTLRCTVDRQWCAVIVQEEGEWILLVAEGAPDDPAAAPTVRRHAVAPVQDREYFEIWPSIVREAGGAVLIGVEGRRATGFSGGGAHSMDLRLFRTEPGEAAVAAMFEVVLLGHADIRACFSEAHARARRDACSDLYDFSGRLTFDPNTEAGRPRFLFETEATTFPGRRSRAGDSTAAPPLRAEDLVTASDPVCSYRRRFAVDPATGRYAPDAPLPDCTDYFDF